MDHDSELFTLVKREYMLGRSEFEALNNLFNEFDMKPQTIETIEKWMKEDETVKPYRFSMQRQYIDLFTAVASGYLTFKHAFHIDPEYTPIKPMASGSRFGYNVEHQEEPVLGAIQIFDHFHGKEQTFQFTEPIQGRNEHFEFEGHSIDQNHMLILEKSYDENFRCRFYLVKIDWPEKKCQTLCHAEIPANFGYVYMDWRENNKFAYLARDNAENNDEDLHFVFEGIVTESQITVKSTELRIKYPERFPGYSKNKFFTLEIDDSYQYGFATFFKCIEIDLENGKKTDFKFECDFNVEEAKLYVDECVWHENFCYLAVTSNIKRQYSEILCLNLDTKKVSFLGIKFQYIHYNNSYLTMDENEVLSIFSNGAAYRFSLRKPEPLQNLCWFSIRRHSLLKDDKKYYENATNQLELNSKFREFCC